MQVGLSINLALQGITSIKTCQNSFNKLSRAIKSVSNRHIGIYSHMFIIL